MNIGREAAHKYLGQDSKLQTDPKRAEHKSNTEKKEVNGVNNKEEKVGKKRVTRRHMVQRKRMHTYSGRQRHTGRGNQRN